jgi:hypothetical protein
LAKEEELQAMAAQVKGLERRLQAAQDAGRTNQKQLRTAAHTICGLHRAKEQLMAQLGQVADPFPQQQMDNGGEHDSSSTDSSWGPGSLALEVSSLLQQAQQAEGATAAAQPVLQAIKTCLPGSDIGSTALPFLEVELEVEPVETPDAEASGCLHRWSSSSSSEDGCNEGNSSSSSSTVEDCLSLCEGGHTD